MARVAKILENPSFLLRGVKNYQQMSPPENLLCSTDQDAM